MSKLNKDPKLVQWANDRFPPISNEFILNNAVELIIAYQKLQQENQELREKVKNNLNK